MQGILKKGLALLIASAAQWSCEDQDKEHLAPASEFLTTSHSKAHDFRGDEKLRAHSVEKLKGLFAIFDADKLEAEVKTVYAQDAYLNDRIHAMRGLDKIQAYFVKQIGRAHV